MSLATRRISRTSSQLEVTTQDPPASSPALLEEVPLDLFRLDLPVRGRPTGTVVVRESTLAPLRAVLPGAAQ